MRRSTIYTMLIPLLILPACSDARDTVAPAANPQFAQQNTNGGAFPGDTEPVAAYLTDVKGAQVANAQIGAEGGSLRLGDFEVIIPAGAVTTKTAFQIRIPPQNSSGKNKAMASFMPHMEFNVPVTIRVPYANTESAGAEDIHVIWWDGDEWLALPSTLIDNGTRLETVTTHFSLYATQRRGFTLAGG